MNIGISLLGQMITFMIFVGFTMKFVWPPITKALADRQAKIADGLAAAERGKQELELAQQKAVEKLRKARMEASDIIETAQRRASQIVEAAKQDAEQEGKRILEHAQAEIVRELQQAKQALREQVATVAVSGAEKILQRNIDTAANKDILDSLIEEI